MHATGMLCLTLYACASADSPRDLPLISITPHIEPLGTIHYDSRMA